MTLCTNCAEAVPYLYTVYHSVNNVRLEQCVRLPSPPLFDVARPSYNRLTCPFPFQPSCRAPADPYVEHDSLVVALDLILLKRGVYRHLLFNRGTPPRKVDQTAHGHVDDDAQQLQKEQHGSTEEEKRAQDRVREIVSTSLTFFCLACKRAMQPPTPNHCLPNALLTFFFFFRK
jgi:hypothetical protein